MNEKQLAQILAIAKILNKYQQQANTPREHPLSSEAFHRRYGGTHWFPDKTKPKKWWQC